MKQQFPQEKEPSDGLVNGSNLHSDQQPADYATHQKNKRNQKLGIIFISVVGVGILFFAFWHMWTILEVPFPADEPGALTAEEIAQLEQEQAAASVDQAVLRQRDTDEDGINDFEEQYIYLTSPYLADSDSDGVSDFDEIKAGDDPNCPPGQTCFRAAAETETVTETETATSSVETDELLNISAEQLRALLVQSGQISQEQLDQLSDEELLTTYKEFVQTNPTLFEKVQLQDVSGTEAATTSNSANLTATEIRQMLREQGFTDEELNQVDDASLIQLYQEALKKAQGE